MDIRLCCPLALPLINQSVFVNLASIITDLCPSLRGGCWLNDIRVPNVSICRRLTFDFRLRGTGPRFCTRERDKFREFAGKFRLISLILVVQVLVIC